MSSPAPLKERVDLTAEKAFTLSAGTRNILAKLDSPVTMRFYCTPGGHACRPICAPYAQEIEDLLGEYQQAGQGKIIVEKFDPKPDSDAEDSARLNGVQGQRHRRLAASKIYLGLVVSMLDEKGRHSRGWTARTANGCSNTTSPAPSPASINPTPPTMGVMSALPVFGAAA